MVWYSDALEYRIYIQKGPTTFYNFCTHAKNGYDFVTYMEQNNRWPSRGVKAHSQNPVGRQRMEQVIANHYGKNF